MVHPEPGDLLRIDGRASVQFAGDRALTFRVVSVCPRPTYAGWVWLTGYVLDRRGQAIDRREVFVQLAGLRRVDATVPTRAGRPRGSPAVAPRSAPPSARLPSAAVPTC
ncbi:hypothetical protein GCM10027452_26880 [Micromonospora halotolerans]